MTPIRCSHVSLTKATSKALKGAENALNHITFTDVHFVMYEWQGDVYVCHKSQLAEDGRPMTLTKIPAANLAAVDYADANDAPIMRAWPVKDAAVADGPGDAPEPAKRGPGRPPKQVVPPLL